MHAVKANVYEMKVIPLLFGQQPANDFPLLLMHAENFVFKPIFPVSAEVLYVDWIFADEFRELAFEIAWIGEIVLHSIRCEKASDADAIHPARRIIRRHSDNNRFFPFSRQLIPHCQRFDGRGVRK